MIIRKYFIAPLIVCGLLSLSSCGTGQTEYERDINKERSERDAFFKYGENSPLSPDEKEEFTGLNYYETDKDFKVEAEVNRDEVPPDIVVTLEQGPDATFQGVATLSFELDNSQYQVKAYSPPDMIRRRASDEILFIPFRDETTGDQTFEGGRYIDVSFEGEELITLDFNEAYQPFCYYNETFPCPEPPDENELHIAVEAGERLN